MIAGVAERSRSSSVLFRACRRAGMGLGPTLGTRSKTTPSKSSKDESRRLRRGRTTNSKKLDKIISLLERLISLHQVGDV